MSPILSRLASTGTVNSIGGFNIGRRRPISAVGASGPVTASGGTQTNITVGGLNYRLHTFTTVGNTTFSITAGGDQIDVFIVGGGGGGGMLGGGGAGGGIIWASATGVALGDYTITVGDGGAGEVGWTGAVRKGNSSSAFGLTALGGGGGLSYSGTPPADTNTNVANTGGNRYSQTGLNGSTTAMTIGGIWSGTAYGGYMGGGGDPNCCSCRGGGGAGAGANGSAYNGPGNGGIGVQLNFDGNNYYWSGGGGADGYCSNTGGAGGLGGGGGAAGQGSRGLGGGSARNSGAAGTPTSGDGNGGAGGANTGGGGGAACNGSGITSYVGGKGGSGIVMVRYRY